MKRTLLFAVLSLVSWSIAPLAAQDSDDRLLSDRHYIDDDDHRRLADLQFQVVTDERPSLRMTISAVGAEVEPGSGYQGIVGQNRYTAEELAFLLSGQNQLEIVTVSANGRRLGGGFEPTLYGHIRERRLRPDGVLDYLWETPQQFPLSLQIDARAVPDQRLTTYLIVNSQSRLRCDYQIINGEIQGLSVRSLGDDPFRNRLYPGSLFASVNRYLPVVDEQLPDPVSAADWSSRDLEGKWVLMDAALQKDPTTLSAWTGFLARGEEYQLLEWLAIYRPDAFHSGGVGTLLATADAAQWVRVAAWHCTGASRTGHGVQTANSLLYNHQPGIVERWLQSHRNECDNWDVLAPVLAELTRDKTPIATASERYLEPLKEEDVYRYLTPPAQIADFGDAKNATEGVVYIHQVHRAIHAVTANGRRSRSVVDKVRDLTRSSVQSVRIHALLAFSQYAPDLSGTEQFADFESMVDDENEPSEIREAALMGWSFHGHPSVTLKLYDVASDASHGAWKAAVSRLGDVGADYAIKLLGDLDRSDFNDEQLKILDDAVARITVRLTKTPAPTSWVMANRIRLAVFADMAQYQKVDRLKKWVQESGRRMTAKQLQKLGVTSWSKLPEIWVPKSAIDPQQAYKSLRDKVTADTGV